MRMIPLLVSKARKVRTFVVSVFVFMFMCMFVWIRYEDSEYGIYGLRFEV